MGVPLVPSSVDYMVKVIKSDLLASRFFQWHLS